MKRGARQHPKMFKLARALSIPHPYAVGLIESLIDFTIDYAPAGDIGRHADEDIARDLKWDGDPAALIEALVSCPWVDRVPCECRLIVHDWHQHAPDSVNMALARAGRLFANGARPSLIRLSKKERTKALRMLRTACVCATHGPTHGVHTQNAPPSPPLPSPPLSSPVLHPSGAREPGITRVASNGNAYTRSGRWPDHHLASVLAGYPAHLRTGGIRALTAIDAALGRIADADEHPGKADPLHWLLARVQAFAASPRSKQPKCWEAPAWFEQGHYDDPDESWNTAPPTGAADERRAAKQAREFPESGTVPVYRGRSGSA